MFKIGKTEKLTTYPFLNLFKREFWHNGIRGEWIFSSRKNNMEVRTEPDAVVIAATVKEDGVPKLLVTKEYRVPLGDFEWGLPAGLISKGEGVEAAARRELLEETGYEIQAIRRYSPPLYSSAGMTDESVSIVFCYAKKKQLPALENGEMIESVLLSRAQMLDLFNLADKGKIKVSGRAWLIMMMYEQLARQAEERNAPKEGKIKEAEF